MLIVGSAAALTAIAAYFVWFLAKRGRELWRQRTAEKLQMRAQPCPQAGSKGNKS